MRRLFGVLLIFWLLFSEFSGSSIFFESPFSVDLTSNLSNILKEGKRNTIMGYAQLVIGPAGSGKVSSWNCVALMCLPVHFLVNMISNQYCCMRDRFRRDLNLISHYYCIEMAKSFLSILIICVFSLLTALACTNIVKPCAEQFIL